MTPRESSAPGWGSASGAGSMLHKSRIGKAKEPLRCQKCGAKDAEQYECLCVLCGQCFKGHTHHA